MYQVFRLRYPLCLRQHCFFLYLFWNEKLILQNTNLKNKSVFLNRYILLLLVFFFKHCTHHTSCLHHLKISVILTSLSQCLYITILNNNVRLNKISDVVSHVMWSFQFCTHTPWRLSTVAPSVKDWLHQCASLSPFITVTIRMFNA